MKEGFLFLIFVALCAIGSDLSDIRKDIHTIATQRGALDAGAE